MALGLVAAGPAAPASPPKPNVLLILAEDLSPRFGSGAIPVDTPSIDRLLQRGRRFERAYSAHPVAGPARVSLLYGRGPKTTGMWEEMQEVPSGVSMPQHFHASGYFTARVGSMLTGPAEAAASWEFSEDNAPDPATNLKRGARRAAQIMAEPRDRPFFLAIAIAGTPIPERLRALYPPAQVTLPGARAEPGETPTIATALDPPDRPGRTTRASARSDDVQRAELAAQAAKTAQIDAQVGLLVAALDRADLWENTVVVLAGVRAPYLGEHGALARSDTLFEEAVRVPLVIVAPGAKDPGAPTSALVETLDVYPTLIELCALPRTEGLEGTSLVPLLADPARTVRRAATSAVGRSVTDIGRSVRTDRYRYTEWPDGSAELFDHDADPGEYTNLAHVPGTAAALTEMRGLIDARAAAPTPPPARARRKPPAKKPNVLFIILDDLNQRVGSYGYPVLTPNIDRLAKLGRRFDRAYAQVPMCNPSRASFLGGRRPERNGLWDNNDPARPRLGDAIPLQEHFHANGYFTAYVGKVWETAHAEAFHWDHGEHLPGTRDGETEKEPSTTAEGFAALWSRSENPDEVEPDGRRARRAAELVAEHRAGPFFIAAGLVRPHLRWIAPGKYFDMYPPESIVLPQEPANDTDDIPWIAVRNRAPDRPGRLLGGREPAGFMNDPALRRQAIAAYYACITFADAQVGVLLDTLDRLKLWDDTVVVLLGDNGHHLGEHGGLWRKDTLFEEALRVPLIVAAPAMRQPGTATRALAELQDVYPTLVELCGLQSPPGLDGVSLVPLLDDPAGRVHTAAYSFRRVQPPWIATSLRTDRFRYTLWPDGSEELYDQQADPDERANLSRASAQAAVLADMRALVDAGPAGLLAR